MMFAGFVPGTEIEKEVAGKGGQHETDDGDKHEEITSPFPAPPPGFASGGLGRFPTGHKYRLIEYPPI